MLFYSPVHWVACLEAFEYTNGGQWDFHETTHARQSAAVLKSQIIVPLNEIRLNLESERYVPT